jgi:CBS domain-containing protein
MSSPPVTIGPDEAVEQAALSMVDHKIGCLPVLDDGRLLGMLTETDVLRYFAAGVSARRRSPTPAAR